jgi:squalene-hopene/tetraprenyl-beta-curcumene cyclase
MTSIRMACYSALFLFLAMLSVARAVEPVTLENLVAPAANAADEPLAGEYSVERALHFLDSAALDWQKTRGCMTCHTNYAYLMARPAISADAPAHAEVRKFAEELVTVRWPDKGPRWDTEVVATATILAFNDAATTGKLHPVTRQALDKMWTLQRDDGGWTWLKCDWPPMESDDDFGVPFAAIGAGVAPDGYAATPVARAGLDKIRKYLAANPPPTLHHRAMVLWAATYIDDLMTPADRQACVDALRALQHDDGGWGLATLGNWQRADGTAQDLAASDGYGTGFVIYVLRRAGVPADDPQIQRGIAWLKTHQRDSGRWFTRSVHADSKHFITHAGTAFALMALASCDAAK